MLSAINIVSSAYWMLFNYSPLTFMIFSMSPSSSWKIISEYRLDRKGERTHSYRMLLQISTALVSSPSILICAFWFQYKLSIHWMSFVSMSIFLSTSISMWHCIRRSSHNLWNTNIIQTPYIFSLVIIILHQNLCCYYWFSHI